MKKLHFIGFLLAAALFMGCADKSRRAEIEQRKAALEAKQDSALQEARQRLAVVDSMLEQNKAAYDQQYKLVMANSMKYKDNSPEVLELNRLRSHRDSLQVEWETLGAKIKYIQKLKK